jgi:hypothetical protein
MRVWLAFLGVLFPFGALYGLLNGFEGLLNRYSSNPVTSFLMAMAYLGLWNIV